MIGIEGFASARTSGKRIKQQVAWNRQVLHIQHAGNGQWNKSSRLHTSIAIEWTAALRPEWRYNRIDGCSTPKTSGSIDRGPMGPLLGYNLTRTTIESVRRIDLPGAGGTRWLLSLCVTFFTSIQKPLPKGITWKVVV